MWDKHMNLKKHLSYCLVLFCFQLNVVCLIVVFYKMLRMKSMENKKMTAKIQ